MTIIDRIQVRNDTHVFREAGLLRAAQHRLSNRSHRLKILSFGCSYGDELVTLRLMFPEAEIVGCDINQDVLAAAQQTVGHIATIVLSEKETLEALGPFDLICAFSVLCLNPLPADFLSQFPPSRFDELVHFLDSLLTEKGLLAITNSTYRFRDCPLFAKYDPIRADVAFKMNGVDVMARDGRPFLIRHKDTYRKGSAFSVLEDEEMFECLFEKRSSGIQTVHNIRVSPPPEAFVTMVDYQRPMERGKLPHDAIVHYARYRYGYDASTGIGGIVTSRWFKSEVHDGDFIRDDVWSLQANITIPD